MNEQQTFIVRCTLPNAADTISGVPFALGADGVRTATDVSSANAEQFAEIPGYQVIVTGSGGAKAIEQMTLPELSDLLADHPSAWPEVEAAEKTREKPRTGVLTLIEQAQAKETSGAD